MLSLVLDDTPRYERDGWLGEGRPVLASKKSELVLHEKPSVDSVRRVVPFKVGWKIVFDESKVVTRESVFLTISERIEKTECGRGEKVTLEAGDRIEYLQYWSEGRGVVRIGDKVCTRFKVDRSQFAGQDLQPKVEWWIRVINGDGTSLGWLAPDEELVQFLKRQF